MGRLRIIFVVTIIAFAVFDFTKDADRDDAGSIISEGEVDVFTMRAGDCFNDSQEVLDAGPEAVEVQELAGLPCSDPHDNEVYAVFDLSLKTFPGAEAMSDMARDACLKRFERFVGKSYDESILDLFPMYPTDQSWSQVNDREVVCAVYRVDLEKLTGSAQGSGI